MANPILDSGSIIVAGGAFTFENTLTKDGAVYNLTGKTVVATIREEGAPGTVVNALLEDMAVTLANSTTTAANGGVTLAISAANSAFLVGANSLPAHQVVSYLLQYKVTTDSYLPQALRFGVRRALD